MSRGVKSPQYIDEFIIKNKDLTASKLKEMIFQEFNFEISASGITWKKAKLGISSGKRYAPRIRFTEEMEEFIKQSVKGTSFAELTRMFNERFGTNASEPSITSKCKRMKWSNGLDTHFQKNQKPRNNLGVGSIRVLNLCGKKYKHIKIKDETRATDNYYPLHRYVWEQAYGKIPEGYYVIFKDRNPLNCELDNLMFATRREISSMGVGNLWTEFPEVNETIVAIKRLENAISEKEKNE